MASIKLKHASGNSTILNSPAANPSADVTLKLPSTTGSAGQFLKVASANHSSTNAELEFAAAGNPNGMQVLEEFYVPCNGTSVTMANGSVAIQNVTVQQTAADTLADVNGSSITYQPPANTKLVIYTFSTMISYDNQQTILGFQPYLDGVRMTAAPVSYRNNTYGMALFHFVHGFRIESTADASIGQVSSWNSTKTIKLAFRRWNNTFSGNIHFMGEGFRTSDGAFDNNIFRQPSVGIKAIGSI